MNVGELKQAKCKIKVITLDHGMTLQCTPVHVARHTTQHPETNPIFQGNKYEKGC